MHGCSQMGESRGGCAVKADKQLIEAADDAAI